jgi:hypothetical protein
MEAVRFPSEEAVEAVPEFSGTDVTLLASTEVAGVDGGAAVLTSVVDGEWRAGAAFFTLRVLSWCLDVRGRTEWVDQIWVARAYRGNGR